MNGYVQVNKINTLGNLHLIFTVGQIWYNCGCTVD